VHYINSFGQDKVIFGTDYPVLDFERTRREIEALGLKDSVMIKLLRENARRLYRLP
jgi:predicted TIM-barrel fold metal-dependent hydrolase